MNHSNHLDYPSGGAERMVGLDVLRFLAVMLVLHVHVVHGLRLYGASDIGKYFGGLLHWIIPPGSHGVDIFFVLSGFLISSLLFKEVQRTGTVSISRFLIRRGLKIYPPFWCLILVTVGLLIFQGKEINFARLASELLFIQNYQPGLWSHTWSLAVEEHFYFLLIGLFYVFKRCTPAGDSLKVNAFPRLFDVVLVLCLIARIITWWQQGSDGAMADNMRWALWVTHVRIDALFYGAMLAYYWGIGWDETMRRRIVSMRHVLFVTGLLLISPIPMNQIGSECWRVFGFILVYVGAGCLLLASLALRAGQNRLILGAAWLGRRSYSVYLWHMLVLSGLEKSFGHESSSVWTSVAKESIYLGCSWAAGIIMAHLVEFPVLRWRDRFFQSRSNPQLEIGNPPSAC